MIEVLLESVLKNMNFLFYSALLIIGSIGGALKARSIFDKWFAENVPNKQKIEADIAGISKKVSEYDEDFKDSVHEFRDAVSDLKEFIVEERDKTNKEINELKLDVAVIKSTGTNG